MVIVYLKNKLYDICLTILFNNISCNFDKPVLDKKYYVFSIINLMERWVRPPRYKDRINKYKRFMDNRLDWI